MISSISRYAANLVAPVTDAAGVTRYTIMPKAPVDVAYQVTFHSWRGGDRLDLIAFSAYGDERLWWLIANANPEILATSWLTLPVGTLIRIPLG